MSSSVSSANLTFTPPLGAAGISYAGYKFQTTGRPQFSRKVKYEIDSPGAAAKRAVVTYEIQHVFQEQSFADNQVRYAALRAALKVTEGLLTITDENGSVLFSQNARAGAFDYPMQWGENMADVTVQFEAFENVSDGGNAADAIFTPAGGEPVKLCNVVTWKETIKTERFGFAVDDRKETNGAVTANGIIRADPNLAPADRRAWLQGQLATLKAVQDCPNGLLVYGGFSRTVRVDALDPDLNNGTDSLRWSIAFSYRLFPAGDYAEAEYKMTSRDDLAKMKRLTTVKGKVRADAEIEAYNKAAEIAALYSGAAGRVLVSDSFEENRVDGTDGADFLELDFSYEFSETIADGNLSFVLTIATKSDIKTGQITTTYSGTVTGQGTSAALDKARGLGAGKLPIALRSDETVHTEAFDGSPVLFVEVTFSYEYLSKGTVAYAEVTGETDRQVFGALSSTISGSATADTYANAVALARTFKMTGLVVRSEKESAPTIHEGASSQFVKVDFSYSYSLQRTDGAISYKVRTFLDYEKWEAHVVYSGSAYGASEAAADALINALVPSAYVPYQSKDERTSSFDSQGSNGVFQSREFSLDFFYTVSMTGPGGGDSFIQSAKYSIQRVYSVNKTILTPIPYDFPDEQVGVGWTPGKIVVSGSVTGLTEAAVQAWARGKAETAGNEEQTEEKIEYIFAKKSNSTIRQYRMDFTYARSVKNLLR